MTETFLNCIVVELGSRVAVGATGDLLSQLGATVIAVEPEAPLSNGKWANRAVAMAGKKSVVLDRAEIDRLAASADVLLLSTDVDPEHKRLWDDPFASTIVCDITAFGHSGPLAGTPLSEGLIEAMCGIVDTTGATKDAPTPIGTPLIDMHSGLFAAGAVIAGLRTRRMHGLAERIDVALFDVGVTSLINFLALFAIGKSSTRSGNRHPLYNPWGTFDASDGTVLICAVTDVQWKVICEVMGRPECATDQRFATSPERLVNHAAVEEVVRTWVATKKVENVERELIARGIAAGRIVRVSELVDDINLRHRNSINRIPDRLNGSELLHSASPFRATPTSGRSAQMVPGKGADNAFMQQLGKKPAAAAAADTIYPKPYAGVRVVEVGQYTVAPLASRLMGALGADVIKVESPAGDAIRTAAPLRADGASYIFAISNTDKLGIVLDLQSEGDRETLQEILQTADILVENLRPNSLAKQGFDKETLRRRHPHLIYCPINGFGTDSAYPGRPALDTVIQAMSGLMDVTRPNGEPLKTGISASDNLGGQFGFVAVSAALELRDRTGLAAHFDMSMQDITVWATQLEWNGKRSHRPAIVNVADGYVAIDAEFASVPAGATRSEVASMVPGNAAVPVYSVTEVLAHPQTKARELVVERPTPQGDTWPVYSLPFKMERAPVGVGGVMGPLGSTDDEVRGELDSTKRRAASKKSGLA